MKIGTKIIKIHSAGNSSSTNGIFFFNYLKVWDVFLKWLIKYIKKNQDCIAMEPKILNWAGGKSKFLT